ncbi:MAG: cytochrome c family protein [Devosia sp.]|uniref:c-type cytochrome n=1 Tax=Devosia sp. TaxID=1871048 RepID=UPI001AD28739|nr:cytochrome c family protein [Devosia sp.]MBN9316377.1 cytochrome c family protein [Devosia sp.]
MVRLAIAVAGLMLSAGVSLADGDAVLGRQKFSERCGTCHSIGGEAAKNGPDLTNLIGRPAASLEGFQYSDGMLEAGQAGVVWDIETLTKFIAKPRSVVNGSNMSFTGYRNPEDVANVIAYLATFSSPQAH